DDAIDRLPAKYRTPFVLCYLEGLTNVQAARRLGCPTGTVATRLARARGRLRAWLTRRGVAPSAALPAAALGPECAAAVPAALLAGTVRAAAAFAAGALSAGPIPTQVAGLTREVLRTMLMDRLRLVTAVVLVLGVLGGGASWLGFRAGAAPA